MGNLYRDQRDVRLAILCRYNWRYVFIGLVFDNQVHLFSHQDIRVALSDLGIIPVVERHQLDPVIRRRTLQAYGYLLRKLIIGSLRRISQPEELLPDGSNAGPI